MYYSGGDVDNGGDYAWGGEGRAGTIWETAVPSPQFCCEPKTALRTLSVKKEQGLELGVSGR